MRSHPFAIVVLLLLAVFAAAEPLDGDGTRARVVSELRSALRVLDLVPGDLKVRDIQLWRANEKRLRERGALVGDFPLPGETDRLRPPLVTETVRSPLRTLGLGLELARGVAPEALRTLVTGPLPRFVWLDGQTQTAGEDDPIPEAPGVGLLSYLSWGLRNQERYLERHPGEMDPRLPGWMLDGIGVPDLADARRVFGEFDVEDYGWIAAWILQIAGDLAEGRGEVDWPEEAPRRIETPRGLVFIGTRGDDRFDEDAWLIVDPGGDDTYLNNAGGARGAGKSAMVVDLAGNDLYQSDHPFSQGAGFGGVGILVDLSGDDTYRGGEFCQGAAVGGVGVLHDAGGRDTFTAVRFAQGAAALGTGLLYSAGPEDDHYSIGSLGQGLGRVAGLGVLRDTGGNDRYTVRPDYESMYSQWTGGRKVHWSFAQGCGFGFYCRFEEELAAGGKGLVIREMIPGGVGVISDDGGDDEYTGSMYAQGTAYFYGLGILLDGGGDDRYVSTWYGQAAAPHFAAGLLVDVSGDDEYTGMNQVQANARDFSSAVLLDLAGNDRYSGEDRLQGCGDVNDSWGLFVDLSGDDRYEAKKRSARGFATNRDPKRQPVPGKGYRDGGVFLDLGGTDEYLGPAGGADGRTWVQKATGRGVGVDRR